MSDRVKNRGPGGPTNWQGMTKAEKRVAAKVAAAKAAARRRRIRAATGALAGLAVIGLILAVFLVVNRSGGDNQTAGAAASPTANGGFPQLPPGADPALATKPSAGPGAGELTKLTVTPLIQGTGPAAAAGQTITVNYVGVSYQTGAEFDASWNGSEPFSFQLGGGNVIKGWDQGLVGVKLGSRVQLDIPSELAYGDNPGGGNPPGPLRFVVDVLGLQ